MAKKKPTTPPSTESSSAADRFRRVTWDDLKSWAGSKIVERGRGYHRGARVEDLGVTLDGSIVAWVEGSSRYATLVRISDEGALSSRCTCPYWTTCKHAVAVILEYLDALRLGRPTAAVGEDDRRLKLLSREEEEDDTGQDEEDEPVEDHRESALGKHLRRFKKEELVALIAQLVARFPEVGRVLEHERRMKRGAVRDIVASAEAHIEEIRASGYESDAWEDDGDVDYGALEAELKLLLDKERYDDLMKLGKELLNAGNARVESSHQGDMAWDIRQCLGVVFEGVARSPKPVVDRMTWVFEMERADEYSLCERSSTFWEQEFETRDWGAFADVLLKRLAASAPITGERDFTARYRRDALSNRAILALEQAGRGEEILPLCEREARATGSYERLVERLRAAGRYEDAERWTLEGIGAVEQRLPGVAMQLRKTLAKLLEKRADWSQIAAMRADEFFHSPNVEVYGVLLDAAEKAGVRERVREAALRYLETGERPKPTAKGKGKAKGTKWPLPESTLASRAPSPWLRFPDVNTLTDVAIHEERHDDVLRFFKMSQRSGSRNMYNENRLVAVAEALKGVYPDEAVGIWKRLAERHINRGSPKTYEQAAPYLRKINRLLTDLGREQDWLEYKAALRRGHARKRRFIELLDGMSGRPLVEG